MDTLASRWDIHDATATNATTTSIITEFQHALVLNGPAAVGILTLVVSAPCAFGLFLLLAGAVNHSWIEGLPYRHGASFMILLLLALLSGQLYLVLGATAVLFGAGDATCPWLTVLLMHHYALVLYPLLGQTWTLYRTLRLRDPPIADESQRILWSARARGIAFCWVALLAILSVIYLVLTVPRTASERPVCRGAFGGFDLAYAISSPWHTELVVLQLALWLVAWWPVPILAWLMLRLSRSRFIPLFGSRWSKIARLWVALMLSLVFSSTSSLHVSPTTTLLTRVVSVTALGSYAVILYFGNALLSYWQSHLSVGSARARPERRRGSRYNQAGALTRLRRLEEAVDREDTFLLSMIESYKEKLQHLSERRGQLERLKAEGEWQGSTACVQSRLLALLLSDPCITPLLLTRCCRG